MAYEKSIFAGLKMAAMVAVVLGAAAPASAQYKRLVTPERLVGAQNEPDNWLLPGGNYGSWRYSKLNEINKSNVANLRMAYAIALGGMTPKATNGANNMGTPLVDGGFMYLNDGWGKIYKVDVTAPNYAKFVWATDPNVVREGNNPNTRGVGLWRDMVIEVTPDERAIAMKTDTGEIVWDRVAAGKAFFYQESLGTAPLAIEDKIIIANAAGDGGTRGWVAALNAATGEEVWRFYMIPAPGQPGAETWMDKVNAWKTGGGGVWTTNGYDPETRVTIWGAGNPVPMYDPEYRPGDNLYTNSAVALDIDTGKLKWHFQYTPNDNWDYDENGVHMIYDATIDGQNRKVVGHFGRNGFFYQLDKANGQFINAGQYVNELTWTKGIDPKTGKPLEYNPKLAVQTYIPKTRTLRGDPQETACPTWHGGVSLQLPAFNPVKKIAYGSGTEGCFNQVVAETLPLGPEGGIDETKGGKRSGQAKYNSDLYYGSITAIDTATAKIKAKVVLPIENRSGVTVTEGGLVFTGSQDGWVSAYDDETLRELWRFFVGTPIKAPPMTFAVGTKQFLAVVVGGRHLHPVKYDNLDDGSYLFVFSL